MSEFIQTRIIPRTPSCWPGDCPLPHTHRHPLTGVGPHPLLSPLGKGSWVPALGPRRAGRGSGTRGKQRIWDMLGRGTPTSYTRSRAVRQTRELWSVITVRCDERVLLSHLGKQAVWERNLF